MTAPATEHPTGACRVVQLEWDRGHAKLQAIVRAQTDLGVIVTVVHDCVPIAGLEWIRADEVLYFNELEDLDGDDPTVRLANLRNSRNERVDSALTELPVLFDHLSRNELLVMLHFRRTGASEGLVGRINRHSAGRFVLHTVDTNARYDGDAVDCALEEIIAVSWGNEYLLAFADLLGNESRNETDSFVSRGSTGGTAPPT